MADLCERTQMPVAGCSHCRGMDDGDTHGLRDPVRAFVARYDGRCPGCGYDIEPGDQVAYVVDLVYHVGCDA